MRGHGRWRRGLRWQDDSGLRKVLGPALENRFGWLMELTLLQDFEILHSETVLAIFSRDEQDFLS
jgi:hypothetical protein